MKKNLNEEINNIRSMMGLEEQLFKKLGDKIKTGVNKVTQTITDKVKPQQQQTQSQPPQEKSKTYEEIRAEYSKVNSDMTNMRGFGEGSSRDEHIARQMGEFNARVAIMKKMGKQNAQFGSTIYYGDNDEYAPKMFVTKDEIYNYLVVMEKTN